LSERYSMENSKKFQPDTKTPAHGSGSTGPAVSPLRLSHRTKLFRLDHALISGTMGVRHLPGIWVRRRLMGHADVKTTEIYTHVMQKDIRAVSSPLETL